MRARVGSDKQVSVWLVGRYIVREGEGEVYHCTRIPVAGNSSGQGGVFFLSPSPGGKIMQSRCICGNFPGF